MSGNTSNLPAWLRYGVAFLVVLLGLGLVLGSAGLGLVAFYLGCTGAWSAWWPGFLNLLLLIGMYKFIEASKYLSADEDKLQDGNTINVEAESSENTSNIEDPLNDESELKNSPADAEKSKISMVVLMVALIVGLVMSGIFLTLGLLNVINLTFALSLAIHIAMSVVSYVLGMYCGNKVKNLYPRFIYASGLVATVTFAFLIAFKVVSLATLAPLVAPSLTFAFLCFVYCVIQRCRGKEGCCCINSVMPEEEYEDYNNIEKSKNKNHNLRLDYNFNFNKIGYDEHSNN